MATKEANVFTLINNPKATVDAGWNGSPTALGVSQNIFVPQTTNGTAVFAATNLDIQNNQGQISLTSGGSQPVFIAVPALANQPTVEVHNWGANNLGVTNTSINNSTTILVQLVGPGLPGTTPSPLPIGTPVLLPFGKTVQGNALPQWMQLVVQSNAPTLGIVAIIGGPADGSGNNGYVIAINAAATTGPGTGLTPPPGYYATTTANTFLLPLNWGSSAVFVANLSPTTAQALSVTLRAL